MSCRVHSVVVLVEQLQDLHDWCSNVWCLVCICQENVAPKHFVLISGVYVGTEKLCRLIEDIHIILFLKAKLLWLDIYQN